MDKVLYKALHRVQGFPWRGVDALTQSLGLQTSRISGSRDYMMTR